MYKLIKDSSIGAYVDNLDGKPVHHICRIKDDDTSVFAIAYRDTSGGVDRLFFDNIAGNEQSQVDLMRYDDLDCMRYDDGDIMFI